MLRFVVLSCALSLVLGLLSSGFLVTILQVGVYVLGNAVNLVLDLGKTLDLVWVHFGRIWLRRDVLLERSLD